MENKVIKIYEHESLTVGGDFTKTHLELLDKFRGDKEDEAFNFYSLIHNGVKFKQYVGVLSVGDLQIEVLPKVDKYAKGDANTWRNNLLTMLKAVYKLKVSIPSKAKENEQKSSAILDVFIQRFLDEVEMLMHRGLVKTYRRVEGNCKALKGRLVMSKHIRQNIIHQERFYVSYTTYDRNHILNRILYKALRSISDITNNAYTKNRAASLMFNFPELLDIQIDEALFQKLAYDRKTEDYRFAIELARLLLLHYMPDLRSGSRNKVLALMFDMNKLWEEYVYVTLRKKLVGWDVKAQEKQTFWHGDGGNKTIRPDIVINKDDKCKLIIDTKWKCPKDDMPSDADLKQMYVYHKYWGTKKTVLLYPSWDDNRHLRSGIFSKDKNNESPKCSMVFIPISEMNKLNNRN